MELELNRTHLTGYKCILDTTVFQEETLETIVSDANPDILRIVDTRGKVFLKGKAISDGRAALTGSARLAVLYLPDSGTGLCQMEINVPFQMTVEDLRIKTGYMVTALPRICLADTRTINPRKVVIRVEIAAGVKVYSVNSETLCTSVRAGEGALEQRTQTHRINCITAVQEKQVSLEEDLLIPAGRPLAEEVMDSRVLLSCLDQKIIGNKLILKGEVAIQMLYRTANGGLDRSDFTLPFSQIVEVSSVEAEGNCWVELALSAAEFLLGGDGRTISASLSMWIQMIVQEEREVELLVDAYSTSCAVKAECTTHEYQMLQTERIGRQGVRESIETGMQMKSAIDTYCQIGRVEQQRRGDQLQITAQVAVTVLCLTENHEYCAVSRRLEVSCAVDVPRESICQNSCRCSDISASPTVEGVEVRFQLEFPYISLVSVRAEVVRDITVDMMGENLHKPSIVLRITEEGESLWDVAKRYGTTVSDIIKANNLENEQPRGGTLLLIPRKR